MTAKLSVVLTVYNMETCLRECVDSLRNQTFSDFEVICIDDGSSDTSLDILEEYTSKDTRMRIYSQENTGPAGARNAGLDKAIGKYIIMLDSDDIFESTLLERLYRRAEDTESDIVICRSQEYDHDTGELSAIPWATKKEQIPDKDVFSCADMYDTVFSAFMGWPWDKLYRRSFIEEHGLRYPLMNNSEDLYFVFLSLVLAKRMSFVDEVLISHRMNRDESVSNSRLAAPEEFYRGICLLKGKLKEDPGRYEKLSWGYLNWAVDYTLWNIETLPEGKVRDELVAKLVSGAFPELELNMHGPRYFNLYDDVSERYKCLLDPEGKRTAHPRLRPLTAFFRIAESEGFRAAFSRIFRRLSPKSNTKDGIVKRGSELPWVKAEHDDGWYDG